jgi:hypothetical protein
MKRFHAKQRELGDAEDQAHARRVATHREASS